MSASTHVAVDLGASSVRISLVRRTHHHVSIDAVERFPHAPSQADGWRWNFDELTSQVINGLASVSAQATVIDSVAVDSWGVDYGWIDPSGTLLDDPYCYRDPRTRGRLAQIDQTFSFGVTGIPGQEINTSTQLLADLAAGRGGPRHRLLFIADLVTHALSGLTTTETTLASTSQLLEAGTGRWSAAMTAHLGVDSQVLPSIADNAQAPLTPLLAGRVGRSMTVVRTAAHDTAAALAATPFTDPESAYVSLGTWACAGVELESPVLTEAAMRAGFTNERGVDGSYTFHRNLMGLWLLQELLADFGGAIADHVASADRLAPGTVIDPEDPQLAQPGKTRHRLRELCEESGQMVPTDAATMTRCVIDSLATSIGQSITTVAELARRRVRQVHIIGGGSLNRPLCQALADRVGVPVMAGPVEATTLGNALVQARHFGGPTTVTEMRALVAGCTDLHTFQPGSRR